MGASVDGEAIFALPGFNFHRSIKAIVFMTVAFFWPKSKIAVDLMRVMIGWLPSAELKKMRYWFVFSKTTHLNPHNR